MRDWPWLQGVNEFIRGSIAPGKGVYCTTNVPRFGIMKYLTFMNVFTAFTSKRYCCSGYWGVSRIY